MHTHLLPGECVGMSTDQLIPSGLATAVDYYKDDLPHYVMFTTEYHQWVQQWEEESVAAPKTLVVQSFGLSQPTCFVVSGRYPAYNVC